MNTSQSYRALQCTLTPAATPLMHRTIDMMRRRISDRCGLQLTAAETKRSDALTIALDLDPTIGTAGYRIESADDRSIRICGQDDRGVLYGAGKFLRTSKYGENTFTPSAFRGTSVPDCSLRGMYIAFHSNSYSWATRSELKEYFEDLALYGLNAVLFHYPGSCFKGPEAMSAHDVLSCAKSCGLKVGLLAEPNIAGGAPAELVAMRCPDTDPVRRGDPGAAAVCPSKPAGFQFLSKYLANYLDGVPSGFAVYRESKGYQDIGIDFVASFPYDAGGCGCKDCWPWGARGYVNIAKEFSRLARERYPNCKFIVSTWCFDVLEKSDGEYEGLSRELEKDKSWADYIMDDTHLDVPTYAQTHGSPGGLPMVNFAEISMWGRFPWGGYGANPLPNRFEKIWKQSAHALDGGFPYSEGHFEDINKFIFSQFFWNKKTTAREAVREYVAYEYSPEVVDEITEAIYLLELTLPRWSWKREDVNRAYELIQKAHAKLPLRVQTSWRWRILYLRSIIDYELMLKDNKEMSDRGDAALDEIISIFHLETGWVAVTPRSRAYLNRVTPNLDASLLPGAETEKVEAKIV